MSQVSSILEALVANGTSTYDDLERSTRIPRNKLRWSCNAMKNDGLIKQTEDTSRNEIAWQITPKGRRHVETSAEKKPAPKPQKESPPRAKPARQAKNPGEGVETPAAGVVNISRSPESDYPVGEATTSTDGRAVEEQRVETIEATATALAATNPPAGSDVMTFNQWAKTKLMASTEPAGEQLTAQISITGSLHLAFAGTELELPCYAVRELGQFLLDTEPAWS